MRCWILMLVVAHTASSVSGQDLPQEPILLASEGGVSIYSVPIVNNGNWGDLVNPTLVYRSAKIVAKTDDPSDKLTRFEGISLSGHIVQTWQSAFSPGGANAFLPQTGASFPMEWIPLDSHLLISEGSIGEGDFSISEENDGSLGSAHWIGGEGVPCTFCIGTVGVGATQMENKSDWFELQPESASNEVELAQIVTTGLAKISVGVSGDGLDGAFFENVSIAFVPEPSFTLLGLLIVVPLFRRLKSRGAA